MPFQYDRRTFSPHTVDSLNEGQPGVYGLWKQSTGTWIIVGETEDLKRRLNEYLNKTNTCVNRNWPTHWTAEVKRGGKDVRVRRETELKNELNPICTKRAG